MVCWFFVLLSKICAVLHGGLKDRVQGPYEFLISNAELRISKLKSRPAMQQFDRQCV
jgi:hypothetical protein